MPFDSDAITPVRDLITEPGRVIDPGSAEGRAALVELYRVGSGPSLRLNMITGLAGGAAGGDGTSDSLSSRTDRILLGIIRSHAELVLVGAQSVRVEGYQAPQRGLLGIVTASGKLDGHRIDATESASIVVFCPADVLDRVRDQLPHARIVTVPAVAGRIPIPDLRSALTEFGPVVCEGGPALAGALAADAAFDDVCLSVSPHLAATTLPALGTGSFTAQRYAPASLLLADDGMLFSRWRADRSSATS